MNLLKSILGFNSPYSWMKWLRGAIFLVVLYVVFVFLDTFGELILDNGIFGFIIAIVIFGFILFYFGSGVAIGGAVLTAISTSFGVKKSIEKQKQSLEESRASGNEELVALDEARLKVQKGNLILTIFKGLWFVGGVLLLFGGILFTWVGVVYVIGGPILFVVLKASISSRGKMFNETFKEVVVRKALESVLTNLDFRPDTRLDESTLKESNLFAPYDVYTGNDYLTAEYKGIKFIQGDVHLWEKCEEETNDDEEEEYGSTIETTPKYQTIFRGRLMVFDYPTISREPVYVFDKRYKNTSGSNDEIKTELDVFNKKFSVIANDPTAAFRILTPPVLEGIALASDKLGYSMRLSFRDDKLYFALLSGNSFESSMVGDSTLSEQRSRIAREVQTVLDVVETLYLKKNAGN